MSNGIIQDLPSLQTTMVKVGGWSLPQSRRNEPPYFSKTQLVDVLDQIAVLMELSGANGFKVRAYQNASKNFIINGRRLIFNNFRRTIITSKKGLEKELEG